MLPVPPFRAEGAVALPLAPDAPLRRALFVRLHAFGDAAIVLPLTAGFVDRFPRCRLEVVTGPDAADLFRARPEVHAVHVLDARGAGPWRAAWRLARALRAEGPVDLLLDLQRSRLSRLLGASVDPGAWALFDRFAPKPALERYREAAGMSGVGPVAPLFSASLREGPVARAAALLASAGRDGSRPLVCLNPAGGWVTKQWPLERWGALGRALVEREAAQLLLLGTAGSRVAALAEALGGDAVDLTGRTAPGEALAAVAACGLCVSEDSGLMHLAWVQGVPTLALLGATRATWSRPLGPHSVTLGSEDLPCGACMQPECARADVHCLDRVSVEEVLRRIPRA